MPGYHHVESVMGTAVSIDVRDDVVGQPGLVELVGWLHHVDRTFSTWSPDSEITRLATGELALVDAPLEVRDVLRRCEEIRARTGGAFDVFAVPAPNGTLLDPSGFVKGWSVERGAALLEAHGLRCFAINAGGDVVVRGTPSPDPAWRIGIRSPTDPEMADAVLAVDGRCAVATSGTYERGAHIVDPATATPTTEVASVTVVGPDLGLADAFATAVFVMGPPGLAWLEDQDGYDGLVITHDRRLLSTAGMRRWLAAPPAASSKTGCSGGTPVGSR